MPTAETLDFAPGLESAFFAEPVEQVRELSGVHGWIPPYVAGSYYLNGPAKFQAPDGLAYHNWLDGDGMVCALHFTGRGILLVSRFVQGYKYIRERDAGRALYRTFGTAFSGDRLKRGIATESPHNVSVIPFGGKLLAFGEQCLPMELHPMTLETRTPGKPFDFNGALNDAVPFSAHPKTEGGSDELLNFGVFFASDRPLLNYYRFNEVGSLACRSRVPLDWPCALHDFVASAHYAIFYLSPYVLDPSGLRERGLATIDSLSWQPQLGSQLLVLCRKTGAEAARILIEGRYCLHTINAFEQEGRLIVDLIEFERPIYDQYQELPDLFVDAPFGRPVRFHIDLAAQTVIRKDSIPYRLAPDFPVIDHRLESRPYDDVWLLGISATGRRGRKFFDRLVHARWSQIGKLDVWECPPGQYLGGAPVFVGDPCRLGDGVVLCHIFDATARASSLGLFNSHNVQAGPMALLHLPDPIHLGFHACFQATEQGDTGARI